MKKLVQISGSEFEEKVKTIKHDDDIAKLGFINYGQLIDYDGYKDFNCRLWVWVKIEEDKVYVIVTFDEGNCNCNLIYVDLYIKEIIDRLNKDN